MDIFMHSATWISLISLTFMEIVLGIDNIVFISIVAGRLPKKDQKKAVRLGLLLALGFRIALLLAIGWIVGLTKPVLTIPILELGISWRDIILLVGGLFLIAKSVSEMHHKLEGKDDFQNPDAPRKNTNSFTRIILQIVLLDIVFSFDSILTAVGLVDEVLIMIIAVIIALVVMLTLATRISDFINKRPTMKMLALSFLLLIGFMLVLEGLHQHIDKGYIYFAMLFSFVVELLNSRLRRNQAEPIKLRKKMRMDVEDRELLEETDLVKN